MRRLFLFFLSLWAITSCVLAAEKDTICYDKKLDEFVLYSPVRVYQAGAKIEKIPSDLLELSQSGGIDNVLMRFTPVYLKSTAGTLSTIRLRGTSANHTNVMFGGLNINSLTLGHSDMSSVPSYLFDELDLQYGSSSVMAGSGAIGGALYLGLEDNWTNGFRVKATTTQGSFGEQLYGTKIFVGNGKFESVTRAFYYKKENDFPFESTVWSYTNQAYVKDTQRNASIENMGVIQELNYKFRPKVTWKTAAWLEHDWHEVQQNMATNYKNPDKQEELENNNTRLWSEFKHESGDLKWRLAAGYVHDYQLYDSNEAQIISTDRLVMEFELKQDVGKNFGYRFGTNQKYEVPDVYSYSDSIVKNELQTDYYLSAYYIAFRRAKFTLNLRQMFASDFEVPFTPSVGMDISVIEKERNSFSLLSNVSRSYRIPTFNDRFWGNQGNPDLKPEDGMNYELGLNYKYSNKKVQLETKLNAFYMDVNNWIEWRPDSSYWRANNVMEVESKGIEFSQSIIYQLAKSTINARLNITLNQVEIVDDLNKNKVGEQLIYTPLQMGNAYLAWKYKGWVLYADGSYTGARNHDYEGTELPYYYLFNAGISKKIELYSHEANINFGCQNLMDKSYQNEYNYAMPGRSFRLGLTVNLNYLNSKSK